MDSPLSGYVLGLSNRQFSIREKRDIVWQLAEGSNTAHEKLQTWSRRDLLEILCSELGKEKKYTGLTKRKLIENIFKIVSAKKAGKHAEGAFSTPATLTAEPQTTVKRQRKNDHPTCFPMSVKIFAVNDQNEAPKKPSSCPNVACRAILSQEVPFCRRCSCCICHKYDENKDPSLWLFCSSEDLSQSESCGLSCHIYCALKDARTGLANHGKCSRLDGSFCCIYCGRMNSLQGCWRKQLAIAKDARRLDVLWRRVSLCHKLLGATQKYQKLNEIVDNALRKLESEFGPLNGEPNVGRGIVNRLSVGAEVQRLCAQAVEVLDNMLSRTLSVNVQLQKANSDPFGFIKFEEMSSSSVVVVLDFDNVQQTSSEELIGCSIWHRKADEVGYPMVPTGTLHRPNRTYLITGLVPSTKYVFKFGVFSERREFESWEVELTSADIINKDVIKRTIEEILVEAHSTGSHIIGLCADLNKSPDTCFSDRENLEFMDSVKSSDQIYSCKEINEEIAGVLGSALDGKLNSTLLTHSNEDSNSTAQKQLKDVPKSEIELDTQAQHEMVVAAHVPLPACRLEAGPVNSSFTLPTKNDLSKPERESGSPSKRRNELIKEFHNKYGPIEGDHEYCIKVIRWLECKGLIESNFSIKFLTWFSLRASSQERRVVSAYINTLVDDPTSLADQVVDTFSDAIFGKRPSYVPCRFHMRLLHH